MAKKTKVDLGTVVGDLVVDLSPDVMVVTTGKGKKQTVDEDATYENITTNIAYYAGMLNALDAISGEVEGLAEVLDEHKEAYDILFAYAEENLDGFSEYAESYGLESFGTQDGDGEGIDLTELERSDLAAIAKQMGIKVMKKDTAESIIEKLEEADEEELDDALTELGYYDDAEEDAEDDEAGDDTEDEEDEEEGSGYEDMSLGDLRKECKAREIKYTPKEKAEDLIAKLEADDEENGEEDEEDDGADYSEMSLSELRAECKERGIKYGPKQKADALIALLEEDDEAGDDTEDEEDEEEGSGYEDMSLGDLRKECKAREIKYTPKEKAEDLIAKLEADDEENGEEDEEDDGADEEEVSESELDEILDEEFEDETLAEEEKAAGKKSGRKLPRKK